MAKKLKKSQLQTLETGHDDLAMTPFKDTEILPPGEHMKIIRLDSPVSNEFLEVLTELSKIKQLTITRYIDEALHDAVKLDLDTPQEIGMDVCKNLKYIIRPSQ